MPHPIPIPHPRESASIGRPKLYTFTPARYTVTAAPHPLPPRNSLQPNSHRLDAHPAHSHSLQPTGTKNSLHLHPRGSSTVICTGWSPDEPRSNRYFSASSQSRCARINQPPGPRPPCPTAGAIGTSSQRSPTHVGEIATPRSRSQPSVGEPPVRLRPARQHRCLHHLPPPHQRNTRPKPHRHRPVPIRMLAMCIARPRPRRREPQRDVVNATLIPLSASVGKTPEPGRARQVRKQPAAGALLPCNLEPHA